MVVTIWSWQNATQNIQNDFQSTLQNGTESAAQMVQSTVTTYGEVLRSASGLFRVDPNLSEDAWKSYIENLGFQKRYPGMQGISYIQSVPASELESFLANQTRANGTRLVVDTSKPRDTYNITRYIEPDTSQQQRLVGYDPATDAVRAQALNLARDSGGLAVSGRVTRLVDKQAGFVLYVPIYRNGAPLATVEQRRAAIVGYVSAGVRIKDLIDGLFAKVLTDKAAIQLFATDKTTKENLVYQSAAFNTLSNQAASRTAQQTITISGNAWQLVAIADPSLNAGSQRNLPRTILWGGTILSVVTAALLLTVMVSRARAITSEKDKEVQEVKDSLIALASHQLRTPATGVKQFIGLVLEGYAGDITPQQKEMLTKAYSSNERQLQIINQILHVSRADSGRLTPSFSKINLTKIVRTVRDEQANILTERRQRVVLTVPKKDIVFDGDQQYICMVVDNLLSNASKYSHPKTTITVQLRQTADQVILTVRDHGVGIEADDMHLLFQKFSRIPNELSVAAGGNGIGLYLCKQIVELHGGVIDAQSTVGKGSTFSVTLPLYQETRQMIPSTNNPVK